MTRPTYRVHCERDGRKYWFVRVPEVSGAFTQTRRLDEVEETARDVVALLLEAPHDSFDLEVEVHLPDAVDDKLARARDLRRHAEHEQAEATDLTREAARKLADRGLTVRDVGRILGVSFQRAQQLIGPRKPRKAV